MGEKRACIWKTNCVDLNKRPERQKGSDTMNACPPDQRKPFVDHSRRKQDFSVVFTSLITGSLKKSYDTGNAVFLAVMCCCEHLPRPQGGGWGVCWPTFNSITVQRSMRHVLVEQMGANFWRRAIRIHCEGQQLYQKTFEGVSELPWKRCHQMIATDNVTAEVTATFHCGARVFIHWVGFFQTDPSLWI